MKLLIQNKKTEKSPKHSNQTSVQARKAAKTARVISIRPVDEAAAHIVRVQKHLTELQLINGAYSDVCLGTYQDGEASMDEKKAELRKSMKQMGAALAAWHCRALDLLKAGTKLKANLADQHKELLHAVACFGGPRSK